MLGPPVVGTFRVQQCKRIGAATPAEDPRNRSQLRILLAHNNVEMLTGPLTARAATHVGRPKDENNSRLCALRIHQVKGLRIDNR
jgi:hypothetical protein